MSKQARFFKEQITMTIINRGEGGENTFRFRCECARRDLWARFSMTSKVKVLRFPRRQRKISKCRRVLREV